MKLSSLTLAVAALAVAGAAFAQDATVTRSVRVGPNGEVTHVTRSVNDKRTRVRRIETPPVIVHRHVVYHDPMWYHHHHVVYVEHHDWHHHNHVAYRD
jgi:hypothetical protein